MTDNNDSDLRVMGLTLLQLMAVIAVFGVVLVVLINYFF